MSAARETAAQLTFGVEIKVLWRRSPSELVQAIRAAGIECQYDGYTHAVTRHWKIVTDASIAGGYEIVSPVLTLDRIDEVVRVCDAITDAGASVDRSCGLHVHVGCRNTLTVEQVRKVAARFIKYEHVMDTVVARSRRANNSRYCQGFSRSRAEANEKIAMIRKARTLEQIAGTVMSGKFRKLNLMTYWRQGTVEFRQHQGSTEAVKVTNWIKWCVAFVAVSAHDSFTAPIREDRFYQDVKGLREHALRTQFGRAGAVPDKAAVTYFRQRAEHFGVAA